MNNRDRHVIVENLSKSYTVTDGRVGVYKNRLNRQHPGPMVIKILCSNSCLMQVNGSDYIRTKGTYRTWIGGGIVGVHQGRLYSSTKCVQ